jgi:hypothetical protein
MANLLEASAEKHLKGVDEIIYIGGEFKNTEELFKAAFMTNYELWKKERCNILTSEVDLLFINESDIFNEYSDFSLFGLNPGPNVCKECAPVSLNSMRYFPHTMEEEIMDYGYGLFNGDVFSESDSGMGQWDGEMGIYNKMFFNQRDGFYRNEAHLREHLNRSCAYWHLLINGFTDEFDYSYLYSVPEGESKVLVFSGTRGQELTLREMKWYNRKYNGQKL